MKVLILCAFVVASQAVVLHHPWGHYGHGSSNQFRSQDTAGNYAFGYNEGHHSGGTFRREHGDGAGHVVGSYGLTDADGRHRVVNYVADHAGFRADVKTNEPGVEPKDPAAVAINKGTVVAAPHHYAYGMGYHGYPYHGYGGHHAPFAYNYHF